MVTSEMKSIETAVEADKAVRPPTILDATSWSI
jgi:hypothetical protein